MTVLSIFYCNYPPSVTTYDLAASPVSGGEEIQLTGTPTSDAHVLFFDVVPGQRRVIFVTENISTRKLGLFSVEVPAPAFNDDFCFPILVQNGGVALICL